MPSLRGGMDRSTAERIVLSRGWLAAQPRRVQGQVLRGARLNQMTQGGSAYQIDDEGGGIYGLADGSLGISVGTVLSGPHLAHIVRPGVWFTDSAILTGGRRIASAQALEPATVLYLPLGPLEALAQSDGTIALALGSLSSFGFRFAASVVADLLIRRADQRIAATLLRVTGVQYGAAPSEGVHLSQAELGEMANASRQLVNRTLGRFGAAGWVSCGYNQITIHDATALAAFVRDGA